MGKQRKQMIILLVLLLVVLGAYFAIGIYNEQNEQKEQEKLEAEEIHITDYIVTDVEKFSYDYQGVSYSFTKQGDQWIYDEDDTLDIDEMSLKSMVVEAIHLYGSDKIENVTDVSQYGLEEPYMTIGLTISGKEYTLLVGDYNQMLALYYAYFSENPDTVYLIDSTLTTSISKTLEDLVVVTETENSTE